MAGTNSFRRREKKFSKKMQRSLDPTMLLSRGLSARFVGANVMQSITPLTKDEIEKDLRHMNAYYQANITYAQQHYIYMNREELEHFNNNSQNQMAPIAMPVRIDPEEEKRLQNLRKKIALCETQREILESQYVSLRAHYVATTKELAAASKTSEGLVAFLQTLTKRRGRVLALHRARLQISREVLACLQTRLERLGGTSSNTDIDKMEVDGIPKEEDFVEVWNACEEMLKDAELACRKVPSTLSENEKKPKKKSKKKDGAPESEEDTTNGVIPWEAIKMPITPEGVPLYLSQLALVPDKGAAWGSSGVFGSNKASMTWMEHSMPTEYDANSGKEKLSKLHDEVQLLEEELTKERQANKELQIGIIARRKRSDELVSMMTLLRSETEAILQRHNILLDSPEAKEAARRLHEETVKNRAKAAESQGDTVESVVDNSKDPSPEKGRLSKGDDENEGDENDGDDEGDGYEDEGEIDEGNGKRELEDRHGDSPSNRKRRKV